MFKFSTSTYHLQTILVQDFVPIRIALGGGGDSFLFIYFIFLPVVLVVYSYIVYFVCVPASEFGAMGSTSFLGFSYPNLLLVFLEKSCRKKSYFCTKFCSHKNRPKGGGDSFLFIYFIFLPLVLVLFLYSVFCLCPSFRVWSDGLYVLSGVFLP